MITKVMKAFAAVFTGVVISGAATAREKADNFAPVPVNVLPLGK